MRIAIAQLDPTVGDIAGNTAGLLDAVDQAIEDGADVLVSAELAVIGYPPRDLLFREDVVAEAEAAVDVIVAHAGRRSPSLTVILGHPRRDAGGVRPFRNSATIAAGGQVLRVYDKRLLPGYDVFDEDRYFEPGQRPGVVEVAGRRLGVLICEDLWRAADVSSDCRYEIDPVAELVQAGCDCLLSLNASPFVVGKWSRHVEQLSEVAMAFRLPLVAVNQIGGNDDLIFDGRSVVVGADGRLIAALPGWRPAVETVDLDRGSRRASAAMVSADPPPDQCQELFEALVLGLRDYCHKSGNQRALLGLSGGIDSALTATIAARALGPEQVTGVFMASRYSSPESEEDAIELAERLGLGAFRSVPIESVHGTAQEALGAHVAVEGVTDENLQARLRGVYLMALSNAGQGLVLATSNKSEVAMGYTTLYGDMVGAVGVLGDVLKTTVYDLARWINAHHGPCGFQRSPMPARCLTKAPSAELRPNQTDQDTLPPYELLDEIVLRYVDREQSVRSIAEETGFSAELVTRTARTIDRAQFKRDQAAVILKVSPRAFGRGRPMPIVMKQSAQRPTPQQTTRTAGDPVA